ncbi:AAA family ATPase [Streptomyces sp. PLK6-54]|uniref:AAA family ATPase n=1 Tax=Actinacidiphila acidipaludis TaxID=2873382 RepID=A0ABS7QDU7_9ACTN|nr:AAA family ATPase [Streptomyces acidipaludis]
MLVVGGRAGAGKTTVGWEVAALLRRADVSHVVVEGDFLDHVYPAPPAADGPALAERNLGALWVNFARLGHHRLISTNTAAVLPEATPMFPRAMGAGTRIIRVLLTASDATAAERLTRRELGSERDRELRNSAPKARLLEDRAPADTVRVATDGRRVGEIARDVLAATGWA